MNIRESQELIELRQIVSRLCVMFHCERDELFERGKGLLVSLRKAEAQVSEKVARTAGILGQE